MNCAALRALALLLAVAAPAAAASPCTELARWRDDSTTPTPRWHAEGAGAHIADEGSRVFSAALESPSFIVPDGGATVFWRQRRDVSWANSAGVLDIAVDDSDWRDITSVGGLFDAGDYDGRAFAGNPLGARPAWGRDTAESTTRVLVPAALARHLVRLRFRFGSGGTGERNAGWFITDFRCEAATAGRGGNPSGRRRADAAISPQPPALP